MNEKIIDIITNYLFQNNLFQLSLALIIITMAIISFAASFTFTTLFQIYGASLTVFNEITRNLGDSSKIKESNDLSFYKELILKKHEAEKTLKDFRDDVLKRWNELLHLCVVSVSIGIGIIVVMLIFTKIDRSVIALLVIIIIILILMQVWFIIRCVKVGDKYKPSLIIDGLRQFKQKKETDLNNRFFNIDKEVK